jgi:hypothetical protein
MSKGEDDEDDNNTMEEDDDDVDDDDEVGNIVDNTAGDENVDGDEGKANGRFLILLFNSFDARRIEVVGGDNEGKRWFG